MEHGNLLLRIGYPAVYDDRFEISPAKTNDDEHRRADKIEHKVYKRRALGVGVGSYGRKYGGHARTDVCAHDYEQNAVAAASDKYPVAYHADKYCGHRRRALDYRGESHAD